MSKVLDYLFCHLGEQMDGWIKDPTLLHSVDHILQSANYAVLNYFKLWILLLLFPYHCPTFSLFWILQQSPLAAPKLQPKRKTP